MSEKPQILRDVVGDCVVRTRVVSATGTANTFVINGSGTIVWSAWSTPGSHLTTHEKALAFARDYRGDPEALEELAAREVGE